MATKTLQGIVNGKTIELAADPGVPNGQPVEVIVKLRQPGRPGEKDCANAPAHWPMNGLTRTTAS
jgi:hypothetical protein